MLKKAGEMRTTENLGCQNKKLNPRVLNICITEVRQWESNVEKLKKKRL